METKVRITKELLQEMRLQKDPVADEVIDQVFAKGNAAAVRQLMGAISKNSTELPAGLPAAVTDYFATTAQLPDWAIQKQMQAGAAFFARHAQPILSILGCMSLPYCYAAADGAQVLYLSQRIRNNTRKRLADTGQFVLAVTDKKAFEEKGAGIRTIQKVRLMHAAIRFHILQSGQWHMAWGEPVNQEDMAGTNLSLSYIVLEGLTKLGVYYTPEEANAYLHLWNVVGFLMGVHPQLLPASMKEAYWLDKMIASRHFKPSEAGKALTGSLLQCFDELTPDTVLSGFTPAYMRFLLGDKVADILALPASDWNSVLLAPVKMANTLKSFSGMFKKNDSFLQTSNALLLALEQEYGKADFQLPATLA